MFLTTWLLPSSSQHVLLMCPVSNFLFLTSSLIFKGLMWLDEVYPDNLPALRSGLKAPDLGTELYCKILPQQYLD